MASAPRRALRLAIAAALAAALAGCAQAPQPGPVAPAAEAHLSLTGCSGWYVGVGPFPAGSGPGTAPAGWEPDPGLSSSVRMYGYECQRLGLGAFERGPVHLVLDTHTRISVPSACRQAEAGQIEDSSVVGTLWVDDADLARHLADAYGIPARVANVTVASEDRGAFQSHTLSWSDGAAPSTMTAFFGGPQRGSDTPVLFAWPRGDGIGLLSIALDAYTLPTAPVLPASGTVQPPALLSGQPEGRFAGTGYWSTGFSAEGRILLFQDTLCTQPVPAPPPSQEASA